MKEIAKMIDEFIKEEEDLSKKIKNLLISSMLKWIKMMVTINMIDTTLMLQLVNTTL